MTSEITTRVAPVRPVAAEDEAGIRAAIDDYYLGWFDADGERMARALHPDLAKRGWHAIGAPAPRVDRDTFTSMVEWAGAGHGRRADAAERRYRTEINDVYGDIAAAVVHAVPYVDYLHLVRTADGWRILNALWSPT